MARTSTVHSFTQSSKFIICSRCGINKKDAGYGCNNKLSNGLSPEHGRLTRAELIAAITRLNNLYGKGDLIEREMRFVMDGRVECVAKLQYGESRFVARFNGRTVYARGHQTTVKY